VSPEIVGSGSSPGIWIVLAVVAALSIPSLWAVHDVLARSPRQVAGRAKVLWVVSITASWFALLGWAVSLAYLLKVVGRFGPSHA
jgi:hypothetical protein